MKIHADFECGNIIFLRQEENEIYLSNEMRGTIRDKAYYWAFCIEGAAGKTLNFRFATPGVRTVAVYSTDGRKVAEGRVGDAGNLNLSHLQNGVYLYQVQGGKSGKVMLK